MQITTLPFKVWQFQYQIARYPLQLIQDRMADRLDAEAPARLFYERSLGQLDFAVGRVLRDPELAARGTALIERGDTLLRASRLDAKAAQIEEQADTTLNARREQAMDEQKRARAEREQKVVDAQRHADERKRAAAQEARAHAAATKKQADDAATRKAGTVRTAEQQERNRITAAEQKAMETPKAAMDDAASKRSEAADKRRQADRVEQLAAAEKSKRQSS